VGYGIVAASGTQNRLIEEAISLITQTQQKFDALSERGVASAFAFQERGALGAIEMVDSGKEHSLRTIGINLHGDIGLVRIGFRSAVRGRNLSDKSPWRSMCHRTDNDSLYASMRFSGTVLGRGSLVGRKLQQAFL
jgi:hypothetical protein